MRLFLTAALLFVASFCFAQSFAVYRISNGEGTVAHCDGFDVYGGTEGKTVELNAEARVSSEECWALSYFYSGSALWAEAPYMGFFHEDFDTVFVQANATVSFGGCVQLDAPPGEYASALFAANW